MNKANKVLSEVLVEAKPPKEEIENLNYSLKRFLGDFRSKLRSMKIDAEVFVGGSFAKGTLAKKKKYDIDVFARFGKNYRGKNLSEILEKVLKSFAKDLEKVHGSRDYFKVKGGENFYFEVVPVLQISNPKEADNITDLSYYHVKYINKKANKKILDEIILAKLFCQAHRVYGAESHIKGFSGYSLELLMCYYKTFEKFLKAMAKAKEDKMIVDLEKHYRNKSQIMMDMNSSKLASPIILVDPTYKQRNALATLSGETFAKFREAAKEFLKNPKAEDFEEKKIDFSEIEKSSKAKREDFLRLKLSTETQEGAIAGSKLLKFYNFLALEIAKQFEIKDRDFYYDDGKEAECYFSVKKKDKEIFRGPPADKKKESERFRKKHKKTFTKSGKLYAEEKFSQDLKSFLESWKKKNSKIVKDMYISGIEVLKS